jgi:hypothetical protein
MVDAAGFGVPQGRQIVARGVSRWSSYRETAAPNGATEVLVAELSAAPLGLRFRGSSRSFVAGLI